MTPDMIRTLTVVALAVPAMLLLIAALFGGVRITLGWLGSLLAALYFAAIATVLIYHWPVP